MSNYDKLKQPKWSSPSKLKGGVTVYTKDGKVRSPWSFKTERQLDKGSSFIKNKKTKKLIEMAKSIVRNQFDPDDLWTPEYHTLTGNDLRYPNRYDYILYKIHFEQNLPFPECSTIIIKEIFQENVKKLMTGNGNTFKLMANAIDALPNWKSNAYDYIMNIIIRMEYDVANAHPGFFTYMDMLTKSNTTLEFLDQIKQIFSDLADSQSSRTNQLVRPQGLFDALPIKGGFNEETSDLVTRLIDTIQGSILYDPEGTKLPNAATSIIDAGLANDGVASILDRFSQTLGSVKTTTDEWRFDNIFSKITESVKHLCGNYIHKVVPILLFVILAYLYYSQRIDFKTFSTILILVVALIGVDELKQQVQNVLSMFKDAVVSQGVELLCPTIFSTLSGLIITGTLFGNIDYSKFMKEFPHAIKDFKRMRTGLGDFMSFIVEVVSDAIAWVCDRCDVKNYLQLKGSGSYETWEWITEVEEFKVAYNATKCAPSYEVAIKVRDLVKDGEKLLSQHSKREDEHYKLIIYHLNTLKTVVEVCRGCSLYGDGFRPEPISLMIGGPPGIGKSSLFPLLCTSIGMKICPIDKVEFYSKNYEKLFYNRISENIYWDGFSNQLITLFEDFAQKVDTIDAEGSEYWEFIRAKNCAPYNLHMSAIADKASTPFTSSVIVCTTNARKFTKDAEIKSINNEKAFTRRIDMGIWTIVTKEYAIDNEADASKRVPDLAKISAMPFDPEFNHLEFYDHDYGTGITDWSKFKKMNETTDFAVNFYETKKTYFDVNNNELQNLAKKIAAQRLGKLVHSQSGYQQSVQIDDEIHEETYFDANNNEFQNLAKKIAIQRLGSLTHSQPEYQQSVQMEDEIYEDTINVISPSKDPKGKSSSVQANFTEELDENLDILSILRLYEVDRQAHRKFGSIIQATFLKLDTPWSNARIMDEFNNYYNTLVSDSPTLSEMPIELFYRSFVNNHVLKSVIKLNKGHNHSPEEIQEASVKVLCFLHLFHLKMKGYVKVHHPLTRQFLGGVAAIKQSLATNRTTWIMMGSLLAVVATAVVAFKLWPKAEPQSSKANKSDPRKKEKASRRVISQAGDPQGAAIVESVFDKNLMLVLIEKPDGTVYKIGNLLGICGNLMVGPKHYVGDTIPPETTIHLKPWSAIGSNYCLTITYEEFANYQTIIDDKEDFAYYCIPFKIFPKHFRDMRKFLVTREQANKMISKTYQEGCISTPIFDGKNKAIMHVQDIKIKYLTEGKSVDPGNFRDFKQLAMGEWEPYTLLTALTYKADLKVGHCGSIVSIKDRATSTSKIWGIHAMGTDSQGYSKPLVREVIEEGIKSIETYFENYDPDSMYKFRRVFDAQEECPVPVVSHGVPFCEVDGFEIEAILPKVEYVSTKTDIIKSPCYDVMKNMLHHDFKKVIPNMSKCPRGGKDILHYSRYKYNQEVKPYDQSLLDEVNQRYYKYLLSCQEGDDRPKRVLTFEESVQGFPGDDSFNGISRSAKPGWPWKEKGITGSKKEIFGEEETYDFNTIGALEVKKRYNEIIEMYKKGIRPFCVAKAFPKDERRPPGKHMRYVSGYEVTLCIIFRSYFGDFCRMLYRGRLFSGVSIGINPYSADWDFLYKKHCEKELHFFGDFSNWDGSQTRQLMWCFLDAANWFYNDEHSKIREMLFEEIFNPKHLYKNVIYSLFTGNSAGHPITPYLNSYSNVILTKYCIHKITQRTLPEYNFELVERNNHITTFGDDGIVSVNPILNFDPKDLQDEFLKYGWTYTDENKDSKMGSWRKMTEGNFLQRGFHPHSILQRIAAPLNLTTILEMSCFTKSRDSTYDYARENIDKAYLELSLHPKSVFDKYSPILREMGFALEHSSDCVRYSTLAEKAASLTEDGFLH